MINIELIKEILETDEQFNLLGILSMQGVIEEKKKEIEIFLTGKIDLKSMN